MPINAFHFLIAGTSNLLNIIKHSEYIVLVGAARSLRFVLGRNHLSSGKYPNRMYRIEMSDDPSRWRCTRPIAGLTPVGCINLTSP